MLRVAFLTTDNRDHHRNFHFTEPCFGPAPEALLLGLAGLPQLEIHILSCTRKPMTSPARLQGGLFYHSILVPRWGWLKTGYLGCRWAVGTILQSIKPDIVHAQGTERDCAVSALAFRGPKLLTLHGNIRRVAKVLKAPPFSYWWLQARLEDWVLPRFDGVICLSHHAQTQVLQRARKTWVIPNAVDPSFLGIQRTPVTPARILCVATVNPLKNQLGLIRALESHSISIPFELHFFGAIDPASRYGKAFLRSIEHHPNFFYGGVLDRAALKRELTKASALILPTFEENCPMVILEAQAAGVPVIASGVSGVLDLIQDGVTGILIQPTFPESISKALENLLKNPVFGKSLSERGRKQVQDLFAPSRIASLHFEIYKNLRTGI